MTNKQYFFYIVLTIPCDMIKVHFKNILSKKNILGTEPGAFLTMSEILKLYKLHIKPLNKRAMYQHQFGTKFGWLVD